MKVLADLIVFRYRDAPISITGWGIVVLAVASAFAGCVGS